MISIIIPVYNTEKYLAECIESVLSQTYTDYEVLIIDDGSTDKSRDIALYYHNKHPDKITVWTKGNGGTASALNLGIEKMKGDWFKWLSADDRFHSRHALQDMMVLISTIPAHQKYIFYTNYTIVDGNGKFIKDFIEPDRTHLTRPYRNVELMNNFYGNGSTSLIHKSLLNNVGKFAEGQPYEDLDYWLRACIQYGHTLYHLSLNTIDYRTHPESLTSNITTNKNLEIKKSILNRYYQYLTIPQKEHLKFLQDQRPLKRKMLYKLPPGIRNQVVGIYKRIK